MKKTLYYNFFCFFMSALAIGCEKEKSRDKCESFRITITPIERRLHHLPKIKSVKWKLQTFGNDSHWISVPGPSSYRITGYAEFEIEALEKIISKFEDFINDAPCVDFPYSENEAKYNWKRSQLFTEMVKSRSIIGSVWVCAEKGLVYFDLEGE